MCLVGVKWYVLDEMFYSRMDEYIGYILHSSLGGKHSLFYLVL